MKLRTRLFLSISALVTVALLGLLLGLVSVLQMASMQQRLVRTPPRPWSWGSSCARTWASS
jgi:uncharacterized BrkB/YihY/UPF0761 family membrane protein